MLVRAFFVIEFILLVRAFFVIEFILLVRPFFVIILLVRAFFVIELCESIKALKVQIANFELYSSSPKEFRSEEKLVYGYKARLEDLYRYNVYAI